MVSQLNRLKAGFEDLEKNIDKVETKEVNSNKLEPVFEEADWYEIFTLLKIYRK